MDEEEGLYITLRVFEEHSDSYESILEEVYSFLKELEDIINSAMSREVFKFEIEIDDDEEFTIVFKSKHIIFTAVAVVLLLEKFADVAGWTDISQQLKTALEYLDELNV